MKTNTSIALNSNNQRFIAQQIDSGRYASASEVLREGLRLLQDKEAARAAIVAALVEGEQSGPAEPFDIDEFLLEISSDSPPV